MLRRTAGACLGALLVLRAVAAQCPADQAHFVLLHPTVRGMSWDSVLSSTGIVVPDTVCALSPHRVSVATSHPVSWAVFSTASGSLHLCDISWQQAPSFCGKPSLTVGTPRTLPVSAAGMPFYVVNHPQFRADAILLAVGVTPTLVQVYTIATLNGGITGISMITPSAANTAQAVSGIFGDADTLWGDDGGVWLVGPGGMARHVSFDGAVWGAEQVADIDSAQTLSACGDGRAATRSGQVYEVQGTSLVLEGQPSTEALLGIARDWAVGENGTVLIREGMAWRSFAAGTAAYHSAVRIAHPTGSAIQLLDTAWNRTLYTWRDSATVLANVYPDTLGPYVNAVPCLFGSGMVTLVVQDADGNTQVPGVTVRRDGVLGQLTFSLQGDTLGPALPHVHSSVGGIQLADSVVILMVSGGGVELQAAVLRSAVIPGCTTTYWAPDTFRAAVSWDPRYDTLVVRVGADSLRLVGDTHSVTVNRTASRSSPSGLLRFTGADGRMVQIPTAAVGPLDVAFHDLSGRCVGRVTAMAGTTTTPLAFALPRTLLCVRVTALSGPRVTHVFTLN